MDFVDIVLYFGYFMVLIAAVLAIGFPLYIASKNPKSLITSGIGLGSILVLFFIAWLISGNEVNASYAEFGVDETAEQALYLADELDFPILVRPSYVLGGQGMKIVINKEELESHVVDLLRKIPNNKLLLDHYLDGAIEAEADAICDGENVYIIGIMEHIEPCGIHSGDSNATLPPFNLGDFVMQQIIDHTHKIALELNTIGLINIQFAVKNDTVYIIEANPRASRTVPFISKAYKQPYVNYATKIMLGKNKVKDLFDEKFVKMWEFYLASCAAAFRYRDLVVFQLQIVKNFQSAHRTRDYIYS